ncbi:hypothetical protein [Confluentibacter lentus]|uniref:hypothetical protein n=1 Tax=Confluentibacter lentus TaxID=1699412 RepID=UPI000C29598D|nr:hypothetical protein [Confluentibacter lentus]
MKFIQLKRKTINEKRYSPKMGQLDTKVTYIKKHMFGMPIKTLHAYRKTYYGEVKDCNDCSLFI